MQTRNPYSQAISYGNRILAPSLHSYDNHRLLAARLSLNVFLNGLYWRSIFRKSNVTVGKQKIYIAYSHMSSSLSGNLLLKALGKLWNLEEDWQLCSASKFRLQESHSSINQIKLFWRTFRVLLLCVLFFSTIGQRKECLKFGFWPWN